MKIQNRSGTRNLKEIWTEMLKEPQSSQDGRSATSSTLMTGSHEMMSQELSGASGATLIGATNTGGGAAASWAVMPLRTGPKVAGRSQTNDLLHAARTGHDYKSMLTSGRSQTKDLHPVRKKEHRSYVGDGESDGEDDSQALQMKQMSLQSSAIPPSALATDSLAKGITHSSNDVHSRHAQGKTASNRSFPSFASSLDSGDTLTVIRSEVDLLEKFPALTTP